MKNKKAFTLIELIAVLVILAILALIVTPIVLNIVKHAKESANKRSVDAYGKSIELAVANYLLDKGEFPTNISDLKIEYSGEEVICNISLLNEDSSVYLSECKVGSSDVKDKNTSDGWYHYGKKTTYKTYKIGDEVTYNGINFYVIENSDENSDSVTLLKEEPLTVAEVNKYGGVGTENNHVNMYATGDTSDSYYQKAYDNNGYGGMAYYSSSTCGHIAPNLIFNECTSDYAKSEVKYVVDAWALDKLKASDLKEDKTGYRARLITFDDLVDNLGYIYIVGNTYYTPTADVTPNWVYNSKYGYWTMSRYEDSTSYVREVYSNGDVHSPDVYYYKVSVRPVITIKKSAI